MLVIEYFSVAFLLEAENVMRLIRDIKLGCGRAYSKAQ